MMRPAITTVGPARAAGVLLLVLAVAVIVYVMVHVTGESGLPADDHLPVLLAALLVAATAIGVGIALLLPRRSDDD